MKLKIPEQIVLLPSRFINAFFDLFTGGKSRPIYFDAEKLMPELLQFDQNFDTVLKEYQNVDNLNRIPAYEDVDEFQYDASSPETKWKVFALNLMGDNVEIAERICPEICKMLKNVPNVFQALFSVLEPGRSIPAHKGPYKGYLRYHLGVKIPKKSPPKIRIDDTHYTWKEGESVLFDDSFDHEVINHATEERVVLIVDILRPMPRLPHLVNKFLVQNMIKPAYAKSFLKKNEEFLKKEAGIEKL